MLVADDREPGGDPVEVPEGAFDAGEDSEDGEFARVLGVFEARFAWDLAEGT